jgi:hypothetical protein
MALAAGKCQLCVQKTEMYAAVGPGRCCQDHVIGCRFDQEASKRLLMTWRVISAGPCVAAAAQITCQHCAAEPLFRRYEDILFGLQSSLQSGPGRVEKADVGSGRSVGPYTRSLYGGQVPFTGAGAESWWLQIHDTMIEGSGETALVELRR